jgi:hypothetical protein
VSAGQPNGGPEFQDPGPEISLASLLNILWRRRVFVIGLPLLGFILGSVYGAVVTPLYEARAIVRPGITGFGTRGGGNREWKLKDLSRWYAQRLYRSEVASALDIELWEVPRIRADFVMKGLQTTEGGNVLTLSILDPDPSRAMEILDTSISAFSNYVLADSTSNALVLSERGLMIQIEDKQREMHVVRNEAERIRLDLEMAVRDSVQLDERERAKRKLVRKMEARSERITADLATYELRAERLRQQVAEVNEAVELARDALFDGAGGDQLEPTIKSSAQMTETEAYRGLLETAVVLHGRLLVVTTTQDSLRHGLIVQELEVQRMELNQAIEFDVSRREIGRSLAHFRLALESGIELQIDQLYLQIAERQAQIAALSPIERVGPITTSPKPVRPRKSRAVSILTFAGLLGGLGMAFVWEYVWDHRREIFARTPS